MKRLLLLGLCLFILFTATAQATSRINISATQTHQTMIGFGAAIAWYESWLSAHPNKSDIYQHIFGDLNLNILRLRNIYGHDDNTMDALKEIVEQARASLGHPINILLSSWSPPATLKKDNVTYGGTLLKTNGQFVYNDFAQWWYDSIQAYTAAGIAPTYISMQNEPDYENSGWETCIFENGESTDYPGYAAALEALYNKLQDLPDRPLILGPESAGIANNTFQNYANDLNRAHLDGYAYHLYHGGDSDNPDSFNANLAAIKNDYGDKPNIMTEYFSENWFSSAWVIQNCLINANASAYLYWNLIWGDSQGLVTLQNPWKPSSSWSTADGYKVNANYYALKHFSKHITAGYVRIGASSDNSDLRTSAFLSPDGAKLSVVVLNAASEAASTTFSLAGFTADSITGHQSVDNNYYRSLAAIEPTAAINLPAQSATTLVFSSGTQGAGVTGVSLSSSQVTINGRDSAQLTATVLPENAGNKTVEWLSSDPAVASVSATGLVSGASNGTATITATTRQGNYSQTCAIKVTGLDGRTSTPCASPVAATLPLLIDGKGVLCKVTSRSISYIKSWNMQRVEINGVDYTNAWTNQMPTRIDGNYYIHYVGKSPWSHLEVSGSAGNSGTAHR